MNDIDQSKTKHRVVIRRPGLLDMMILSAAFGPALLILRERYEMYSREPVTPAVDRTIGAAFSVANTILMAVTLAFALIILTRPRAKLRVILRRPGPAAFLAASAAIIVMTIRTSAKTYAMLKELTGEPFKIEDIYHGLVSDTLPIGFAVLGAWLMLLLTRAWRPEPSWINRVGCMVGWGWISLTLLHMLLPWIEAFIPKI